MGARGPKPKPAEVAIADGTYRPDRHGIPVDVGTRIRSVSELECPEHLYGEGQRAAWMEAVGYLTPLIEKGAIQDVDAFALEALAVAIDLFRRASREVAELPRLTIDTPNGSLQQHPSIGVANKAAAELRAWATRFGLTTADRVGLGLQTAKAASMGASVASKIGAPRKPGRT